MAHNRNFGVPIPYQTKSASWKSRAVFTAVGHSQCIYDIQTLLS